MSLRLAAGFLAVLAALGYVGFLVLNETPSAMAPGVPYFYRVDENAITRIDIAYLGQAVRFTWDASSKQWVFDDGAKTPVSSYRWGGIPLLLSGPRVDRVLTENLVDPARYGLDAPSVTISVTMNDGQEFTILLGDPTADGQNRYAMLRGSTELVLVNTGWADVLIALVTDPPYDTGAPASPTP